MIEVISRHTKCTNFNLDYNQMPAVALQHVYNGSIHKKNESIIYKQRVSHSRALRSLRTICYATLAT